MQYLNTNFIKKDFQQYLEDQGFLNHKGFNINPLPDFTAGGTLEFVHQRCDIIFV
jgi:hypothetical protein